MTLYKDKEGSPEIRRFYTSKTAVIIRLYFLLNRNREKTPKSARPEYIIGSVAKLSAFDVDSLMRVQLQKIF